MSYQSLRTDLLNQFEAHKTALTADATRRPAKPLLDSTASFLHQWNEPTYGDLGHTLHDTAAEYDAGNPQPLDMATVDAVIAALTALETPPAPQPTRAAASPLPGRARATGPGPQPGQKPMGTEAAPKPGMKA